MARRRYNDKNNMLAGRPFMIFRRDFLNRLGARLGMTTSDLYRRLEYMPTNVITPPDDFNEACNRAREELIRRFH